MLRTLKSFVHASTKTRVRNLLGSRAFENLYFSQEGDIRLFNDSSSGIYVDIGAHHPFRFSNTYVFYKRGWRGINVDAMPGSMTRSVAIDLATRTWSLA